MSAPKELERGRKNQLLTKDIILMVYLSHIKILVL
jgi:hypothetical protein